MIKINNYGQDYQAKSQMAMASVMGGLAFRIGPGVCHFLSHKISTGFHFHHDLSNTILLPHIMEFNLDEIQDKVVRIAFAMRLR